MRTARTLEKYWGASHRGSEVVPGSTVVVVGATVVVVVVGADVVVVVVPSPADNVVVVVVPGSEVVPGSTVVVVVVGQMHSYPTIQENPTSPS